MKLFLVFKDSPGTERALFERSQSGLSKIGACGELFRPESMPGLWRVGALKGRWKVTTLSISTGAYFSSVGSPSRSGDSVPMCITAKLAMKSIAGHAVFIPSDEVVEVRMQLSQRNEG